MGHKKKEMIHPEEDGLIPFALANELSWSDMNKETKDILIQEILEAITK